MFFDEPISVSRSTGGTYVNGKYVGNARTTIPMYAAVQPLSGRETLVLPEGKRDRDSIKILIDTQLIECDESTGVNPDLVTWLGNVYEVHSVKTYTQLFEHYECIAVNMNKIRSAD